MAAMHVCHACRKELDLGVAASAGRRDDCPHCRAALHACLNCHAYDASMRYQREGTPLVVLAGKEYGTGSSRDWAAKGPLLLGVRAVLAETFERIHRSNLVGMGILPLQYEAGKTAASLGLTGQETFSIRGLARLAPRAMLDVEATRRNGEVVRFKALARVDDPTDINYLRNGGVLPMVLREYLAQA